MAYTYGDVAVDPVAHLKKAVAAHHHVRHQVSEHVKTEHVKREAAAKDARMLAEVKKPLKM